MQENDIYTSLKDIETTLEMSFCFIGGLNLVKKQELYSKFQVLYNVLPQELIANRDNLTESKEENIFTLLNKIESTFNQAKSFLGLILIDKNIITGLIDKIYITLPEDIAFCKRNNDAE